MASQPVALAARFAVELDRVKEAAVCATHAFTLFAHPWLRAYTRAWLRG